MHPSVELEEGDGRDVGDACVVQFQYSDYKNTKHYLVNNSKLKPYIINLCLDTPYTSKNPTQFESTSQNGCNR